MAFRVASIMRGSLGSIALAALGFAIAGNALWFQGGDHPAPLFAARSSEPAPITEPNIADVIQEAPPPAVRARPDPTILAIQQILLERGYYAGAIDGIAGVGTERAVRAYQADTNLETNGLADAQLLSILQSDRKSSPVPQPSPKVSKPDGIANVIASTDAALPVPTAPSPSASKPDQSALQTAAGQQSNQATQPSQPTIEAQPDPAEATVAEVAEVAVEPDPDPRVRAVQEALSLSAYGTLTPDGLMGPQTAEAIRRFQLDQGLTVTGQVDDKLVSRLIRVGAMASN